MIPIYIINHDMFSNIYEQEQTTKVTRHDHLQTDNMNHIG